MSKAKRFTQGTVLLGFACPWSHSPQSTVLAAKCSSTCAFPPCHPVFILTSSASAPFPPSFSKRLTPTCTCQCTSAQCHQRPFVLCTEVRVLLYYGTCSNTISISHHCRSTPYLPWYCGTYRVPSGSISNCQLSYSTQPCRLPFHVFFLTHLSELLSLLILSLPVFPQRPDFFSACAVRTIDFPVANKFPGHATSLLLSMSLMCPS